MELERLTNTPAAPRPSVGIVGRGRLGRVISAGLRAAGVDASEPLGRDAELTGYRALILCVPDAQIAPTAALIEPGPLVGHCSGATPVAVLAPHEAFGLHPLMSVTLGDQPAVLHGAGAAIGGSTARARRVAWELAEKLGLRPFALADEDRAAYHAAASMASNFLITLEAAAAAIGASTGLDHERLVPLVRATVENWAALGPRDALTGPVARGDELTVRAQRAAVAERSPELVALFDELVRSTRALLIAPGAPAPSRRAASA